MDDLIENWMRLKSGPLRSVYEFAKTGVMRGLKMGH
jgi:hypothetical protein